MDARWPSARRRRCTAPVPSLKSQASSPEPQALSLQALSPPNPAPQILPPKCRPPSPAPKPSTQSWSAAEKICVDCASAQPSDPGKANRGSQPGLPATRAATPQGEASRNPVCADRGQKECPVAAGANGALSSFRFLPSDAGLNLRGVRPRPDFRLSAARSIAISFARASIARAVALALREGGLTVRWRHAPSAGC